MNPITRFMKKLSILFGSERFVSELDEEMAFHRAQVGEGVCGRRHDGGRRALRGDPAVR